MLFPPRTPSGVTVAILAISAWSLVLLTSEPPVQIIGRVEPASFSEMGPRGGLRHIFVISGVRVRHAGPVPAGLPNGNRTMVEGTFQWDGEGYVLVAEQLSTECGGKYRDD
jgi:hypothetical protein